MRGPNGASGGESDSARCFLACLEEQDGLCRALEALADTLPSCVDTRAADRLAGQLRDALLQCHQLEEAVVFPAILGADVMQQPIIDRLRLEHIEDEDSADEVCDAMEALAMKQNREDTEDTALRMRCLFMSLRRHCAFDRDYVLPLFLQACRA